MQIVQHRKFDEKAAENSIKPIEQIPLRGIFYDRNMKVIVNNVPAYTLRITPAYYDEKLNKILEAILDVSQAISVKFFITIRFILNMSL